MSARKPSFTAAQRAILDPLAVRCVKAAVEQSETLEAHDRCPGGDPTWVKKRNAAWAAHRETCRAGKAFARALRKIQGGK